MLFLPLHIIFKLKASVACFLNIKTKRSFLCLKESKAKVFIIFMAFLLLWKVAAMTSCNTESGFTSIKLK